MKYFLRVGQKAVKALTVTMLIGVIMVFMGGLAYAQEKSVTEKLLDIMLANHEISKTQYDALLKQAEAEKRAEVQKVLDAQRDAEAQAAAAQAAAAQAQTAQAATAKVAAATPEVQPRDFHVYWQNGLRFTSNDLADDIHIGGRAQIDMGDAEPDTLLARTAAKGSLLGTSFASTAKTGGYGDQVRRARIQLDGKIWNNVEFNTQFDFSPSYTASYATNPISTKTATLTTGNAVNFADMWVGVRDLPCIGRIRVGQMYEPISLEQQTSDNWTTFMEKGLPVNGLVPNRNVGVATMNTFFDDRLGYQAGYFFQQQVSYSTNGVAQDSTGDLFSPHLDSTNAAARITALPWFQNNGEQLVHLGIGYEHKFRNDIENNNGIGNPGYITYSSSPEANMFSPLVNSGTFLASGVDTIDPEFAFVCGPFSVQAEYMYAMASNIASLPKTGFPTVGTAGSPTNNNASFHGWYAYASYFLTGEYRPYNRTASPQDYQATFGRPVPKCNFDPRNGGIGAWELAFRVSQLDLNDPTSGFNGGFETDYTAGINWYLNPNVMVKMNYVHAEVQGNTAPTTTPPTTLPLGESFFGTTGTDNIYEMRFQVAF